MKQDPRDQPLPTLAYLMTDVASSTKLWETRREEMRRAISILEAVVEESVSQSRGSLVRSRGEGDSHFAVFQSADDAVAAAIDLFSRLKGDDLLQGIKLRAGIHIGIADLWAGDYYGSVVNRCARIRQCARPGQILVSEAVRTIAGSDPAFSFRDLGVHRLRDLMQPERLFQVIHPDLDSQFAPPDTLSELSHNLPSYLTSFVGRCDELAELGELILANRLTTVTGPGGVGKTRLTQQVAAEKVELFKDGAWFIDFGQTDRGDSVMPIICREIDPGIEATEAKLLESLAHREMLLILDNCEHLFEQCKRVAELLLRHCPGLRILATSRRRLEVAGEYVLKLGGLKLPEQDQHQNALQYDGVRLFVERSKQRGTALPADESTISGIVTLCAKLDGLPLAIEMAASLTDVLSIREITRSIGECLELATGAGGEDSRQRTISATIDWSIKLLSPDAAALLERSAFFPNTWTLEAAGAVCLPRESRSRVLELVRELINHSLVFSMRTPAGEIRFGLLQTTRQLVSSRAGSQSFLAPDFVAHCKRILATTHSSVDMHEVIEQEYETLVKGLEIGFESAPMDCAEMALSLRGFWMSGNRLPEGRDWYEKLLRCKELDRSTLISVQIALSSLYILLGDNEKALIILEEAEETVRPIGGVELMKVIGNLAVHRDRIGLYKEAKEGFEQCCELARKFQAKREEALSLLNLGVAKMRLDEPLAECGALFREARACARSGGFTALEAKAFSCLAHVALKEGQLIEALDCCRQGLILWLSDTVVPDSNLALLDVAAIFIEMERFEAAASAVHIAEKLEQLSHSPLPDVHRERIESLREAVKKHVLPQVWRSEQRLTRSKSVQELTTMAILLIEAQGQKSAIPAESGDSVNLIEDVP